MLDSGGGHRLHWVDTCPTKRLTVLILPAGPGAPHDPRARTLLNGLDCRTIQFDPRGCGQSVADDDLVNNTTQATVGDIERLRRAAGVDQWLILGHLWGSALALSYAQTYPERCLGLVLASVYLGEDEEVDWFFGGAGPLVPGPWSEVLALLAPTERSNVLAACAARLNGPNTAAAIEMARALMRYDLALVAYRPGGVSLANPNDDYCLRFMRVFTHYLMNRFFLGTDMLLDRLTAVRHLPARIVQGRFDIASGMRPAYRLAQAWPEATSMVVDDGCGYSHEPMRNAVLQAMEQVIKLISVRRKKMLG